MTHTQTIPCPKCKTKMCLSCCIRYGHKLCAFCRKGKT